ncbi:Uncharacterised protein [Vibrio cholerae]|nr:Uncharacterised protein [Vibrio cholerae]
MSLFIHGRRDFIGFAIDVSRQLFNIVSLFGLDLNVLILPLRIDVADIELLFTFCNLPLFIG